MTTTIYWFRKALRLHDNPSLLDSVYGGGVKGVRVRSSSVSSSSSSVSSSSLLKNPPTTLYPVYVLDPWFANPSRCSSNRFNFLLESLRDLDESLRRAGSRLFILRGNPEEAIPKLCTAVKATRLVYEREIEPYAKARDAKVHAHLSSSVEVRVVSGHTLFDPDDLLSEYSKGPLLPPVYQTFLSLCASLQPPVRPFPAPTMNDMPKGKWSLSLMTPLSSSSSSSDPFSVPSLEDMGFEPSLVTTSFKGKGGEMAALARLSHHLAKTQWIKSFEKPETSPNSLEPSTTALSPYVSFGCLGARQFYWGVKDVYASGGGTHAQPPVSLEGQLLWREFFYAQAATVDNFDKMKGNPVCRQIDWQYDSAKIEAWESGRTGYPFIDAIMNQLRTEGWIHHLARHAVACFLTRGDLYQSWEVGARIFDKHLIDSDWALNCGNWMWLSASAYFHQFFRVYSPVAFGKKTDKEGHFIRKWVPQLKKLSSKYIYTPWEASSSLLKECNIVLGETYPQRICVHEEASKANMALHGAAYARKRESDASGVVDGTAGSAIECDGIGQLQLASNPAAALAYAARFKVNVGEMPKTGGGGGGGGQAGSEKAATSKKRPSAPEQTIEEMFKKTKKGEK